MVVKDVLGDAPMSLLFNWLFTSEGADHDRSGATGSTITLPSPPLSQRAYGKGDDPELDALSRFITTTSAAATPESGTSIVALASPQKIRGSIFGILHVPRLDAKAPV